MRYKNVVKAVFRDRPNRFIANVELDGRNETVHIKNTGRCREILREGAEVYLVRSNSPARKTAYDLVAVKKGERVVNMDSQAPNRAVEEWLKVSFPEYEIRREYVHGDSRFDFMMKAPDGKVTYIEVKGVTLEDDGHARFPDAPTLRGVKHINGLIKAHEEGSNDHFRGSDAEHEGSFSELGYTSRVWRGTAEGSRGRSRHSSLRVQGQSRLDGAFRSHPGDS